MAILPTKQRDQIMVLVVIVALSLAGAYWYFVFDPKSTELEHLSGHVDTLDMLNQKAKAEMAKGTLEEIRAEARASRENLDLMRTLVPAANEVPSLIDHVSTAARRAHLDIGALQPEPVIEGEMFDTYRYRLAVTGPYHDIAEMLTNIGSLNRIVSSLNLQLALAPAAAGPVTPGTQPLASTFELQTYVVRTSPRSVAPKKGAPGAPGAAPGPTPPPAPSPKPPAKPGATQ